MFNKLIWLKHFLGFHNSKCVVPCANVREETTYTCVITFRNFSKTKLGNKKAWRIRNKANKSIKRKQKNDYIF